MIALRPCNQSEKSGYQLRPAYYEILDIDLPANDLIMACIFIWKKEKEEGIFGTGFTLT